MLYCICEREGYERCEINSSVDPKVREERGRGGAAGTRAENPLWPLKKSMVKQTVLLDWPADS